MKQRDLAELLGIAAETVSRAENSKRPFPKNKLAYAIMEALSYATERYGVSLADLLRAEPHLRGRLRLILNATDQ